MISYTMQTGKSIKIFVFFQQTVRLWKGVFAFSEDSFPFLSKGRNPAVFTEKKVYNSSALC